MRPPWPLRGPGGGIAAVFLAVLAWRVAATGMAAGRAGVFESAVASMTILASVGLALLPLWVVVRLRPRLGWDGERTHASGLALVVTLHIPMWLWDRAAVFGDPGFVDRYYLVLVGLAGVAALLNHGHNLQAEGRIRWPQQWVAAMGAALAALGIAAALALPAAAHTPAFAPGLGTVAEPVVVPRVEQSWALLQPMGPGEVAVFARDARAGDEVSASAVLLATRAHVEGPFRPSVAVAGPGLGPPARPLPVELPAGWGAVVADAWDERAYEAFSEVPILGMPEVAVLAPRDGRYLVLYWDPEGDPGELWAAMGRGEAFTLHDLHIFPAAYVEIRARFWPG